MFRLLLVTDRRATGGRPLLEVVEAALRGGVDAVQLREKDLGGRALLELGRELRAVCSRYRAQLLVNGRIDVALACAADGVQLPADAFAPEDARRLLGKGRIIGASTHSAGDVEAAAQAGVDFAILGPVFATPAKQVYGPPLGLAALAAAAAAPLPIVAIGGITSANARSARAHGAAGVAAIAALLGAADPEAAARAMLCDD